jgi:hypothetical protein
MRRLTLDALIAGAVIVIATQPILGQTPPAPAQRAPAPARPAPPAASAQSPYKPVAVTIPGTARDPGFEAVRKDLAEIAKRRDRAALGQRIVTRDFFWERDFSGSFDARKSSLDNLAAALMLESEDAGWDALGAFATEASVGPLPGRPSIICSPAIPQFNDEARGTLIESTQTDGLEWSYPRAAGLQVRAAPQSNATVIDTLGLHFVRVLGFEDKDSDPDPARNAWARVATPSGKTGFVAPNSLLSPYADRLCFAKEGAGAWRIAGYVGGGD